MVIGLETQALKSQTCQLFVVKCVPVPENGDKRQRSVSLAVRFNLPRGLGLLPRGLANVQG
jgi:hypothetical protein